MLGRPVIAVPVFMNVWAGSWLIGSVSIERMMADVVGDLGEVRQEVADLLAALAVLLELGEVPLQLQLLALELGDRLALGERLGHRLAVQLGRACGL